MNAIGSLARCLAIVQSPSTVYYTGRRCIGRWVAPTIRELVARKAKEGPQPESPRSSFLEWNRDAELYAFNSRLSERFDLDLLLQALTFRSYIFVEEQKQREVGIKEPQLDIEENTDLIDDGRRTTETIAKAYLCKALPRAPEECICAILDYLMSQEVLAEVSSRIGTKDLILTAEYPPAEEVLALTFLALVSALARSPEVDPLHVSNFVRDFLVARLAEKELAELWSPNDPEGILNDILKRENRELAEPRLIGQAGTESLLAVYHVAFYSNKEFLGKGFGETIEEARKAAAFATLVRMFGIADSSKPIQYNLAIDVTSGVKTKNLPLTEWCRKNVDKIVCQ